MEDEEGRGTSAMEPSWEHVDWSGGQGADREFLMILASSTGEHEKRGLSETEGGD